MHATARAGLPRTRTASARVGVRWVGEGVSMTAQVDCGDSAQADTRTQQRHGGGGRSERRDATRRCALPVTRPWRRHCASHR